MKWTREWLSLRYRFLASQLSNLDLQAPDPEDLTPLEEEDLLKDLRGDMTSSRYLGFFTRRGLINLVDHLGLIDRLRKRGFTPHLDLRTGDADRQLLRVYDGAEHVPSRLLVEAAARIDMIQVHTEPDKEPGRYRMLVIDWLLLQNPKAEFSGYRPRLPGQNYPGLRLGAEIGEIFILIAMRLHCDGVLATPQYYHNGVLYSRKLRCLEPERQGELWALERDLSSLSLAEQSWAIDMGCVEDTAGEIYRWPAPPMLFPFNEELADYISGKPYRERMTRARDTRFFQLDMDRFERSYEPL